MSIIGTWSKNVEHVVRGGSTRYELKVTRAANAFIWTNYDGENTFTAVMTCSQAGNTVAFTEASVNDLPRMWVVPLPKRTDLPGTMR